MQRGFLIAAILGVFVLFPIAFAGSEEAAPKPAASAPAKGSGGASDKDDKKKERKIKLEAQSVDYNDATSTYVFALATVELPDSNAVLRADRIEWNKSERWMRATGKPRMWDENNELTADVIQADLRAKRANADGNVRLVARPKEAKSEQGKKARSQVKEPVVVQCDTMQYFYKEKKGTGTGNLRLTQKDAKADRTATAERLSYDGNDEQVILEGDVQVNNTRGEGFSCKRVTITIKDGAEGFRVEGMKKAVFFVQEDEDEEEGKKESRGGSSPRAKPPAPGAAPASE